MTTYVLQFEDETELDITNAMTEASFTLDPAIGESVAACERQFAPRGKTPIAIRIVEDDETITTVSQWSAA